jgi:hypothetical protein
MHNYSAYLSLLAYIFIFPLCWLSSHCQLKATQHVVTVNRGEGPGTILFILRNQLSLDDTITFAPHLNGDTIYIPDLPLRESGFEFLNNRSLVIDASALPNKVVWTNEIKDESKRFRPNQIGFGFSISVFNTTYRLTKIKNIHFHGYVTGFGSGNHRQQCIVEDCLITNFKGAYSFVRAGIEWVNEPFVILKNCEFVNSNAIRVMGIAGKRGYSELPGLVAYDCKFLNCENPIICQDESRVQFIRCLFEGNYAKSKFVRDACITNFGTNMTMDSCIFSSNKCDTGSTVVTGYNDYSIFRHCLFKDNIAEIFGVGALSLGRFSRVEHCVFRNNTSGLLSGVGSTSDHTTFKNCLFENNRALDGSAGVLEVSGINVSIDSCKFVNNSAGGASSGLGGAILINPNSPVSSVITNSEFIGNHADGGGGAFFIPQKLHPSIVRNVKIANCLFMNNSAPRGGAFYNWHDTLIIAHNTFIGNRAAEGNDGINLSGMLPKLLNNIFASYAADSNSQSTTIAGSFHSLGGNLFSALATDTLLHVSDQTGRPDAPLDLRLDAPDTCNGLSYIRPLPGSPARRAGRDTTLAFAAFDVCGNSRPVGCIDAGAFQVSECKPTLRPAGANNSPTFTLYPNPTQGALVLELGAGIAGGEVEMLDGTGRTVLKTTVQAGQATVQIDGTHLPAGLYLCRFFGADGQLLGSQKVVISR